MFQREEGIDAERVHGDEVFGQIIVVVDVHLEGHCRRGPCDTLEVPVRKGQEQGQAKDAAEGEPGARIEASLQEPKAQDEEEGKEHGQFDLVDDRYGRGDASEQDIRDETRRAPLQADEKQDKRHVGGQARRVGEIGGGVENHKGGSPHQERGEKPGSISINGAPHLKGENNPEGRAQGGKHAGGPEKEARHQQERPADRHDGEELSMVFGNEGAPEELLQRVGGGGPRPPGEDSRLEKIGIFVRRERVIEKSVVLHQEIDEEKGKKEGP